MKTKQIKPKHRELYELLRRHKYKLVSLEDFRKLLNVSPEKYTRFNDLKKRVINVFQADINDNSDIRIEYKLKKKGRDIIAINFSITEQRQLDLFQAEDHKIPESILNIIPLEHLNSCIKTCKEILHRDGVAGLRFYITECNKNFTIGYYNEYLTTLFSLRLYDDYLDAQELTTEAIQEKDIAKHRAALKQQEKAMNDHLNHISKWWNRIKHLSEITWIEIEKSINGLHAGTARRKIAALRSFALWQLRAGDSRLHTEVSRVLPPKIPGRIPKDRGAKQFQELSKQAMELCEKRDRRGIWIGLMLCCGLRISEIQVVELSPDNTIKVIGKGNKERMIPVPRWLYNAMLVQDPDSWKKGRHLIWLRLKLMKIKRPHSLRHTYASQLIRSDFKLEEVKGLLGHAKLDTTLIYAKIKLPDDVAKRLGVE